MRRGLLITGLILLVIFGAVMIISYEAGQSDCATNLLGQEANPSACSADEGGFALGLIIVIVALILVILGAVLKSSEVPAIPATPMGGPVGVPSGKVCLKCGTYYPDPAPPFCSRCGAPVAAPPPPPPPPSA